MATCLAQSEQLVLRQDGPSVLPCPALLSVVRWIYVDLGPSNMTPAGMVEVLCPLQDLGYTSPKTVKKAVLKRPFLPAASPHGLHSQIARVKDSIPRCDNGTKEETGRRGPS